MADDGVERPARTVSPERSDAKRRGLGVIPTLFTMGNLFCGFTAILLAFDGKYTESAWMVMVAAACDGLDGRVARLLHVTSAFGEALDSLADLMSFGAAPALLIYRWGFTPVHDEGQGFFAIINITMLVAFFFAMCGAARLARFNATHGGGDPRYFVGLPIPMGAGALILPVAFSQYLFKVKQLESVAVSAGCMVYVILIGILMVSRIPYRTFKDLNVRARNPTQVVMVIGLILILLSYWPPIMLVFALLYLVSPLLPRRNGGLPADEHDGEPAEDTVDAGLDTDPGRRAE